MNINERVDNYLPERRTGDRAAGLFMLFLAAVLLLPASRSAAREEVAGPASIEEDERIRDDVHESVNGLPGVVEEPAPPPVGEEELNGGNMGEPDVLPEGQPGGAHIDGVTSFSPLTMVTPPYTDYPYRYTVYLVASWSNHADTGCTGSLIDSRWVLTTRTCIYQETWGGAATQILVYPGYDRGNLPYGYSTKTGSIHYWAGTGAENNLGFFAVDRPVGGLTGWYQLCSQADSFYTNSLSSGVGYPFGSGYQHGSMYSWSGTFDSVAAGTLFHNRVGSGMLGSPAFTQGIYDCIHSVLSATSNSGSYYARLTLTRINQIKAIIGETRENLPTDESFFVMNVVPSQTIVNAGEKLDWVQFDFYNDLSISLDEDTLLIASIVLIPWFGGGNCAITPPVGYELFYIGLKPRSRITLTVNNEINVPRDIETGEYILAVCVKVENHDEKVTNLKFFNEYTSIDIYPPVLKPLMLPVVIFRP